MKGVIGIVSAVAALAACTSVSGPDQRARVISSTLTSTVQLFDLREGNTQRAGSGIVLGRAAGGNDTLILTTRHFLEPLTEHTILVVDPLRRKKEKARIVAVSDKTDLAIVAVSGLTLTPVSFKGEARLGDPVWVVAFPWGRRRTVVSGVVSQIAWSEKDPDAVPIAGPVKLIDAAVSYGTSGGGVYDANDGTLLGIVRSYRSAELALPGSDEPVLKIPVAGETTVVPTPDIYTLLEAQDLGHLIRQDRTPGRTREQ